jgi:ATP-binding cassette, subfamily B, bacterial
MPKKFPHFKQSQSSECGATCLQMIARYYGRLFSVEHLLALSRQREDGVSLLGISEAAEQIGMHAVGARLTFARLIDDIPLPGIAHWEENHFVVVVGANDKNVTIADPDADGVVTISKAQFLKGWTGSPGDEQREGVILLMEPAAAFFWEEANALPQNRSEISIWKRFFAHRRLSRLLAVVILLSAVLAFVFPFLLETIVDEGIENQDGRLLGIIILAWATFFICQIGLDFLRHYILFHIGTRLNIRLVSEFMMKILKLPVRFFLSRRPDDVMQVLYDNPRMQRFLTNDLISAALSTLLFLAFSIILAMFSWPVFFTFLGASAVQGLFILYFLKRRKTLNYERHNLAADHYSHLTDLIKGVRDMRLNNATRTRRWTWERSEARLYSMTKRWAASNEISMRGPFYIGELRNLIIIYLAARAAIDGSMPVGILVAIIFIIFQLSNPLKRLIDFLLGYQEVRQTLRRMNDIAGMYEDTPKGTLDELPEGGDIEGIGLSFRYDGDYSPWVVRNQDFKIERGTITGIIGPSGSGKTTLLNLLLGMFQPEEGILKLGGVSLNDIMEEVWLERCGVVPQDGYIFHDTIARNIALSGETIDSKRLLEAARIANVLPFLERFRDGFNTVIGEGGTGLSKGQRQSILIARAVYKNPGYLFLDEATNDLDTENERVVLKNIQEAFEGKTIVIVSSRMSLPIEIGPVIHMAVPNLRPREDAQGFAGVKGGNGDANPPHYDDWFPGKGKERAG